MPLIFLIISSVINVALGLLYIYLKKPVLIPRREHFKFDKELYQELAGQGFSMGMMMAIVSSGTVILQRSINGFGYLTIAAHATARKINSFCIMPCATVSASLATFVSQNKGADNRDRIIKGVTAGFKIVIAWLCIPALGYFGVIICEPVIWCLMCSQLLYSFFRNRYIRNSGKKNEDDFQRLRMSGDNQTGSI